MSLRLHQSAGGCDGALSAGERNYPPSLRSGAAAGRSYPPLEARGCRGRSNPTSKELMAARVREGPSGPTRNFSKFQETSLRHTGDQVMNLGSVIRAVASSLGVGRTSRRKAKSGCALFLMSQ